MSFDPEYGETPLPFDELDSLLPAAHAALDEPITRAAVYDLEQAIEERVSEELLTDALSGKLSLDELLTDHSLRKLHLQLYGEIWSVPPIPLQYWNRLAGHS